MNLSLNQKLIGGFLLVALLGLVVGIVGLFGLRASSRALADVRSEIVDRGKFLVDATDLARSAQVNFKIQVQEWKNTLLRGHDQSQFDKYWEGFGKSEREVQQKLGELVALLNRNNVPSDSVSAAMTTHQGLGKTYRDAIKSYDRSDPLAYQRVDKLVKGVDRAPTQEIDAIVAMVRAFEADAAEKREAQFHATANRFRGITTAVMVVGVSVAIGLGLWIGRSLSGQIRGIARSLRHGSDVVDTAASELSRYGQSLADSTNREAASIQQASASLEILADNTRENAQSAQSATEIANQTRKAVNDGKRQMLEMEAAMGAIRESSDGISHILKSIDEIAFQTNILALNAAVEAARAGAAGSGFAVVADEVRNLAQRSAKAARETSTRIEDSISKSKRGVEISGRVSLSLEEILSKASELDELVAKIARSVEQNSEGVDQVNAAIRQIENAYQSNAAITQESASAAQELSEQALSLNQSIRSLSELVGDSELEPVAASSRSRSARVKNKDATPVVDKDFGDFKRSEKGAASVWN